MQRVELFWKLGGKITPLVLPSFGDGNDDDTGKLVDWL